MSNFEINNFNKFLDTANVLLVKAAKQKNAAWWLYKNNLRTPMFMLEALSKVYAAFYNKKKFTKLKERFKAIEDAIGAIDYYSAFADEFATNKKMPFAIVTYLKKQVANECNKLNELLQEDEWLNQNRIKKIKEKLNNVKWLSEQKQIEQLKKFYAKQIEKIYEFYKSTNGKFDNVEEDVHELRRKLRWLSIYPQALAGSIQLVKSKKSTQSLKKYLQPEIINSPFNKMPDAANHTCFLMLNRDNFFALSWMIATLGQLKDKGLKIAILKEALRQGSGVNDNIANKMSYELVGKSYPKIESLLQEAEKISSTFFKEKCLDNLVIASFATIN